MCNYKPPYSREKFPLYDLRGNVFNRYSFKRLILKKENKMIRNRTFIVTLASAGFAAQLFVLICNGALNPAYGNIFNAVGALALFVAFVLFVLGQRTEESIRHDRDELYRDLDQVYRYVDDSAREIRTEMYARERGENCNTTCRTKR